MTIARRQLIDGSVTRWYHCMSRCVRGASLLGNASADRKAWLEKRIEELAQIFAIGVGGFSLISTGSATVPTVGSVGWKGSLKNGRWFGRFFASSGEKLREMASRLNVQRVINLAGCAAP